MERRPTTAKTPTQVDTQPFFQSKRAAAVLKHAILSGYVVPFASKTGSTATGRRVVIVDGYAGAGRYEDGSPGSPALIAAAANHPALRNRVVECLFVEKDKATYEKLCRVLADEDNGGQIVWEAINGNVEDHLDELLSRAEGVPLFLFLDPFGLGLPFEVITEIFQRRPSGQYAPATEVFFRFDASAIRRIRGALHTSNDYPARQKQLEALDRAAGGTWWRDEDNQTLNNDQYVDWFMEQLLAKICKVTGCAGWSTDVRQRPDLKAAYLLVFLTRHRAGMEVFGETLSLAQSRWRRAVFDEAIAEIQATGQEMLADPDELFKNDEQQLANQWEETIERNIRVILRKHDRFTVRSMSGRVYEGVLGDARTTHLRKVLKKMHTEGLTTSNGVGDLPSKVVIRTPGARL